MDRAPYETRPFSWFRQANVDVLEAGRRKHHIPMLLEVDVTEARQAMRRLKEQTGEGVSFTGWVMACIGRAVSEQREVQAMRKGNKLIIFEDVDICVLVEKPVAGTVGPVELRPMPYVVRQADKKTVRQIHDEIRAAQSQPVGQKDVQLQVKGNADLASLFFRLPKFLRDAFLWRPMMDDPFSAKKTMGTVVVTSVGSASKGDCTAWAIPISVYPLAFGLGSIARKPGVVGDQIAIREYLCMTILFDHDVTDGSPVARFSLRLKELIENAYGLVGEEHESS